ncbi:MAG TPA: 50S ribosomal protein L5 [Flavobacteriales bacterium]|nr:50S ribosomal protein L5 [Flavobacteriales bacterium]
MSYVPRLKEKYKKEIVSSMQKQFSYKNVMMVPKLKKICINQGIGDAVGDKKMIEAALKDLSIVTGQKAVPTKSRKDISNFKLRKGVNIGTRVTLRGDMMFEFLDRLISVSLPRTRDFRGVNPKGFDGSGNFTFGVKEHIIFPEMDIDKVNKILGMDITFVTSAKTNEEAKALITEFGFPFTKKDTK